MIPYNTVPAAFGDPGRRDGGWMVESSRHLSDGASRPGTTPPRRAVPSPPSGPALESTVARSCVPFGSSFLGNSVVAPDQYRCALVACVLVCVARTVAPGNTRSMLDECGTAPTVHRVRSGRRGRGTGGSSLLGGGREESSGPRADGRQSGVAVGVPGDARQHHQEEFEQERRRRRDEREVSGEALVDLVGR